MLSLNHMLIIRTYLTADVTVDWINDKLYWVDRNAKKIVEYDLKTGFIRTVYSTGTGSLPTGLVVYPFPNYG